MARPISFRWDAEFVARVDGARGDVPRSAWVRRAVIEALERAETLAAVRESAAQGSPTARRLVEQQDEFDRGEARVSFDRAGRHAANCKCPVCS